jgi:hypothetical protein
VKPGVTVEKVQFPPKEANLGDTKVLENQKGRL